MENLTGEIPMPRFVIERQYLLPIYQRLIIDAPTSRLPVKRR